MVLVPNCTPDISSVLEMFIGLESLEPMSEFSHLSLCAKSSPLLVDDRC